MRRGEIPTYFHTIISLSSQSRLKASLVRPPETMLSEEMKMLQQWCVRRALSQRLIIYGVARCTLVSLCRSLKQRYKSARGMLAKKPRKT